MNKEVLKEKMDSFRTLIKSMVADAVELKGQVGAPLDNPGETIANITIAYRHLEDAAMRFGKAIQASDGGVSPLGGPNTPTL